MRLLACLTLVAATATTPVVAQRPTVDAVVDGVLAEYGGAELLASLDALLLRGRVRAHPRQEEGSFERLVEGPGHLSVALDYPSGTEVRVLRGPQGWRGVSMHELAAVSGPLVGAMMLQSARASIPWILHGMRRELTLTHDEGTTYVLSGLLQPGMVLTFVVDKATNRVLRSESRLEAGPVTIPFATEYSDFRRVSGLLVAFREDTWASGTYTATSTVASVILNPDQEQRSRVGAGIDPGQAPG